MNRFLLCLTLSLFLLNSSAQEISSTYFRSPLDIPLFLSGNFGELRSNHFHAGLDIKTQGVEGQKVYAVADGYVSRIKVSPYGYGNALYIVHPNGFTSVYGHLQKYNDQIAAIVKAQQYKKESFEVQLFPAPFQMQVKKGDLIAYSGNSGGSGGPHLHFEIRKTSNEHPQNPLFFGFDIKDQVKPDIYAISIYPLNDTSFVNGKQTKQRYQVKGANGNYQLVSHAPILLKGEIGFGIETVDRMSYTSNKYGLYNIQLSRDSSLVFEQQMDEFAFHEGRYINSLIDYETYLKQRRRVQKSFVDDGNKLRIYKTLKNQGKLVFSGNKKYNMYYLLSDLNGNQSQLSFEVIANQQKHQVLATKDINKTIKYMPYHQRNTFLEQNILVDLPKGVLYSDIYFEFEETEATSKTISPIYWLHENTTPLHDYISISIKMKDFPKKLKEKALIVSTTDGKSWYAEGGSWNEDNISTKTRSFGGYAIAVDSTPPKITPINIYPKANMNSKWSISLKVTDNLSGINSYRGTVDGKWILMEYDAKYDKLSYYFDEKISKGKHTFKLIVKDSVGNFSVFEADFVR